jgi:hypothetical protein
MKLCSIGLIVIGVIGLHTSSRVPAADSAMAVEQARQ